MLNFGIGDAQKLLLAAALAPDKQQGLAALQEWWRGVHDFDEVRGTDSGLFSQIYWNLGSLIGDPILAARMKGVARHLWIKNNYLVAGCAAAVGALNEAGIPVMLIKGAAIATAVDTASGLRGMSDCDILVPFTDAIRSATVLSDRKLTERQALTRRDLDIVHSIPLADQPSGAGRVDLHWRPVRNIGAKSLAGEMFAAGSPARVGDQACLVPSFEHMVFLAIAHGTEWSPYPRYDWLVDTVKIVRLAGPSFSWEALGETAKRYRFGFLVGAALSEARRHFPDLIPQGVDRHLAPWPALLERREAALRLRQPSARTVGEEMLLAVQTFRRANGKALRASPVKVAPRLYRSLYGPLPSLTARRLNRGPKAPAYVFGWSAPQPGGRWSEGHLSSLLLSYPGTDAPTALRVRAQVLPTISAGTQTVQVFAGFRHLGSLTWTAGGPDPCAHTIPLPNVIWRKRQAILRFEVERPTAPMDVGLNEDPRALGIFVEELGLVAEARDALSGWVELTNAGALPLLWHGWSAPEDAGAWTFGKLAVLRWRTSARIPPGHVLFISLVARAPGASLLTGRFVVDEEAVQTFAYPPSSSLATTVAVALPRAYRRGETVELRIEIDNPAAAAAADAVGGSDRRPLGLMVARFHVGPETG